MTKQQHLTSQSKLIKRNRQVLRALSNYTNTKQYNVEKKSDGYENPLGPCPSITLNSLALKISKAPNLENHTSQQSDQYSTNHKT